MSYPLSKPTPTRRGTINLGLRRKSSAASLAPSINGKSEEGADDNASISSKTDKRPVQRRMFSLLAPRVTKSSMPEGFNHGNGNGNGVAPSLAQEPSELSESGSDHGLNGSITPSATGSLGSSFFSARRSSGGTKIAAEVEKKRLEDQIQALTTEKSSLEGALRSATAEMERLTVEAGKNAAQWDAEREKLQEESVVRLLEKDGEVKSLSESVVQLKEELARAKAVEEALVALRESTASDVEAKLDEREERVREAMKEEKEGLELKLTDAQTALEAKDEAIRVLEEEALGLEAQLTAAREEALKIKESAEALAKKETELQTEVERLRVSASSGGCSIM